MAYTESAQNAAVDAITALGDWMSIHSADPGTSGANESSTARMQSAFPAAAAGESAGSEVAIPMPAGSTASHFGVWNAETGGTFVRGGPLPATSEFGTQGVYNLTDTVTFEDLTSG